VNDYMSITDPAALHAAVERNLHDDPFVFMVADATADGVMQATAYAPHNKDLLSTDWIKKAVHEAARDDDGILGLPADGSAVVVLSHDYSTTEFPADEWHRRAHPLSERGEPVTANPGSCHRCDVSHVVAMILYDSVPVRKQLTVFHIARGRFVVEFAVCDQCYFDLTLGGTPIVQVVSRGAV
jgi:hypothetical protein